jgi:hypothetical protein
MKGEVSGLHNGFAKCQVMLDVTPSGVVNLCLYYEELTDLRNYFVMYRFMHFQTNVIFCPKITTY